MMSFVAAGMLTLVGCNTAGSDGDPGLSEHYDGVEEGAKKSATEAMRDELSEHARQDAMDYRATEDWHRGFGQATEEAYEVAS
jgi:hypothetical protein